MYNETEERILPLVVQGNRHVCVTDRMTAAMKNVCPGIPPIFEVGMEL